MQNSEATKGSKGRQNLGNKLFSRLMFASGSRNEGKGKRDSVNSSMAHDLAILGTMKCLG